MPTSKIKLFEMVELTVPTGTAAGSRVVFNTIPQLRNQLNQVIHIKDIEVFPITSYAKSQTNPAINGMVATEISKLVLVLYTNGEEGVKQIPLVKLIHTDDKVNPFQQEFNGFDDLQNVDWDKSYVQFNAAAAAGPYVIPFGVTYMKLLQKPGFRR